MFSFIFRFFEGGKNGKILSTVKKLEAFVHFSFVYYSNGLGSLRTICNKIPKGQVPPGMNRLTGRHARSIWIKFVEISFLKKKSNKMSRLSFVVVGLEMIFGNPGRSKINKWSSSSFLKKLLKGEKNLKKITGRALDKKLVAAGGGKK